MPMKAAIRTRYGPPEVVGATDVRSPVPEADEVLTRVTDTTVNRTECGLRVGRPS